MRRRSRRRSSLWQIEEQEDGTYDVTRGHRSVATGLRSIASASRIVEDTKQDDDRVYFVEPDGYRTEMKDRR